MTFFHQRSTCACVCLRVKFCCGLHVAYVRIICPVRDITNVRKCTRPYLTLPYCNDGKLGGGTVKLFCNVPEFQLEFRGLDKLQLY